MEEEKKKMVQMGKKRNGHIKFVIQLLKSLSFWVLSRLLHNTNFISLCFIPLCLSHLFRCEVDYGVFNSSFTYAVYFSLDVNFSSTSEMVV
ncbi:hypothetical protein Csa_006249 [Cucumis sativus]|uniref:Uncharacterized protein n=1 Tax=Cucumis sativus TaxID=3659 RepID=A0A0A0LJU0_CUCSA|nr:hypothetical protein Csa_006249 [Cucumis sativus]